jgi:VanZ family protein
MSACPQEQPVTPSATAPGYWLWAAWLAFLVVWTFSLLTPFPVRVEREVLPQEAGFPTGKLLHVGCYAALAALAMWLPTGRFSRWWLLVVLSLHGVGTEFFQTFVPDRTGCVTDVGIDHAGLLCGLVVTSPWWLRRRS